MTEANSQHARVLAVHSVDEFVFSVPDLEQARHFYSSFGLDVRNEDGALALYTFAHPHRWGRVLAGADKRLLWLSLGIHAEDAQRFERHLCGQQVARIAAPTGADGGGLWIQGPDGLALELRVAAKSSPSQPAPRVECPFCHRSVAVIRGALSWHNEQEPAPGRDPVMCRGYGAKPQ